MLLTTANASDDQTRDENLTFSDCTIGNDHASLLAECTTLAMPLDHQDGTNGQIDLRIARIRSSKRQQNDDAFTFIAGGPGQSALETFPSLAFAFRHILKERDLILIDQRGTGQSARLDCEQAADVATGNLNADLNQVREDAAQCLDDIEYDTELFTTSMAVRDLEDVRKRLGIRQWNIYGISYGTRVALHYLRRYPDKVRTLILDAVVPPTVALGPDIAALAQRSLDLIFQRCTDEPACLERFGNLSNETDKLIEELRQTPRSVNFENVATGQKETIEFTHNHLAITLRLMTYNALTASIIPSMLHDAIVNDNFAPLARQASLQTRAVGGSLAAGMHHSIVCTEDIPLIDNNDAAAQQTKSYLGDDVIVALQAGCEAWPAGRMDVDFHTAVSADVPTMILSGDADPITPPSYGELVAQSLPDSLHIVNPHQGHMQAAQGCMPQLMAQFVSLATSDSLPLACLERLYTPAFFIDANGPLP